MILPHIAVVLGHFPTVLVHVAMFLVQTAEFFSQLPFAVRLLQILHHPLFEGCGHLRIGFHLFQNGLEVWVIPQILHFLLYSLPIVLSLLMAVLPLILLVVLKITVVLGQFPTVLVKLLVVLVVFPAVLAHLPPQPAFPLLFPFTPAVMFFLFATRASSPHGSR